MSVLGAGTAPPGLALAHKQQILQFSTSVTLYLALCVLPVNPDLDTGATITETSWPGYQRARIDPPDWAPPDDYGRLTTINPISFPSIGSAPVGQEANWWALCDAPIVGEGNLRWSGPTPPITPTPLDPIITIPPGLLTLAFA